MMDTDFEQQIRDEVSASLMLDPAFKAHVEASPIDDSDAALGEWLREFVAEHFAADVDPRECVERMKNTFDAHYAHRERLEKGSEALAAVLRDLDGWSAIRLEA